MLRAKACLLPPRASPASGPCLVVPTPDRRPNRFGCHRPALDINHPSSIAAPRPLCPTEYPFFPNSCTAPYGVFPTFCATKRTQHPPLARSVRSPAAVARTIPQSSGLPRCLQVHRTAVRLRHRTPPALQSSLCQSWKCVRKTVLIGRARGPFIRDMYQLQCHIKPLPPR